MLVVLTGLEPCQQGSGFVPDTLVDVVSLEISGLDLSGALLILDSSLSYPGWSGYESS